MQDFFRYRAKAEAIDRAWRNRKKDFATLKPIMAGGDTGRLIAWCRAVPFIGDDTQFQPAKKFGMDT